MTRLRPVCLLLFAALSASFALSACDASSVADQVIDNTFSLTISSTTNATSAGASDSNALRDKTVDGYSFFYDDTNPETDEQVFAIYFTGGESLGGDATGGLFGFLARNSGRPEAGKSYTVVQQDRDLSRSNFVGALYEEFGSGDYQGAPYYLPTSGLLTINASSSDEVAGSINIEAVKVTVDTTGRPAVDSTRVEITGEFTARDISEDQFLGLPLPSSN